MSKVNPTRRKLLAAAGTGAIGAAVPIPNLLAQTQIVVSDPGGPYTQAYRDAFYDPFEKATGIKVIGVARESQPVAQFTAMVETKNYMWDVTTLTLSSDIPYLEERGLLEPIGLKKEDYPGIMPEALRPDWLGIDVYSTVLAYRTDKFKEGEGPSSWKDFWDTNRFPGHRSLRRNPLDTLEGALMADGVPMEDLYPLDVDRAFESLDRIRKEIDVWWTSAAQSMQLIQSGEVDMVSLWNGRAQAAIDDGAPVAINWNQGLYSIEGWGIPKGVPKSDEAKEFVRFCTDAELQAIFTDTLAYGPTNLDAYEFIDPERAKILPTAPQNLEKMRLPDPMWWKEHRQDVTERFNSWILG